MNTGAHGVAADKPERPFPLMPLVGAALLIGISISSVAVFQWLSPEADPTHASVPAIESIELRFEDMDDGGVAVIDALDGRLVHRLEPGSNGFVRATLRGLARSRRAIGVGNTEPFRLERLQTGQLVLTDTVTGQQVDLWAFGQSSALEFAAFLQQAELDTSRRQAASATPGGPGVPQLNSGDIEP